MTKVVPDPTERLIKLRARDFIVWNQSQTGLKMLEVFKSEQFNYVCCLILNSSVMRDMYSARHNIKTAKERLNGLCARSRFHSSCV
jgi:hypothetical protein